MSKNRNNKLCRQNKKQLIAECGRRCMLCGRRLKIEETTYHHIVPLYAGGSNDIRNGSILGEKCCHIPIHKYQYGSKEYYSLTKTIRQNKVDFKSRRK